MNAPEAPPRVRPPTPRLFATREQRSKFLDIIGERPAGAADVYYHLLRASWLEVFFWVSALFVGLNAVFGGVFWAMGGIENAHADSYLDHFFFSVHTLATIGYGSMFPRTAAAEWVVTFEAMLGIFYSALITGMAFARFARPTARVLWADKATLSDREGVPTLMFRVANERMNHVIDASVTVALMRDEVTQDGERQRRAVPMSLVRASSQSFALTWSVMHLVDAASPFWGQTPDSLRAQNAELVITVIGLDETLMQTIHTHHSYVADEIHFGARYVDILGRSPEGRRVLDLNLFHQVKPAPLTLEKMGVSPSPTPAA